MPYLLAYMTAEDIDQVARIERLCFSMPWPTSAYRRELKTPDTNRYVVAWWVSPALASRIGLREPSDATLTALHHPELSAITHNGSGPAKNAGGLLSRLASMLPWWSQPAPQPPPSNGVETNGREDVEPARDRDFEMAGYAGLWLMVDEGHVTTIGVHPDHRGQGVGELLFLGLTDIAREMRAHRITLEVRVSNLSAQALYRKYGLEIAGVRRRYYSDNNEDAYIMWSEPVDSPQFNTRIATLRKQLTDRFRAAFQSQPPPAHASDRTRLQ
jgi:[ribosomal protein S18]-alanine N-acetyltransferase